MPKDFSQDGAAGAFGGNSDTATTSSTNLPGTTVPAVSPAYGSPSQGHSPLAPGGASFMRAPGSGYDYAGTGAGAGKWFKDAAAAQTFNNNTALPLMFEDGGEVPGGGYDQPSQGIDYNAALATVQNALNYGRAQYGLQQMADASNPSPMPRAPASQSESGIPATRPFPRLDPLPKPFGKRADAGGDNDSDDQPGGIPDNDADDQEETA